MLRLIFLASFIIGSACALHLEYLKMDSTELTDGTLDEDLLDLEALIPGSCWLCKKIVTKVKKRLGSHEKAEKIREKLRRSCDKLGPVAELCKKLVNRHIDILVKELSTDDNPKTVCAKAGICKNMDMLDLIQVFPQNVQIL
ncbi:NK-lysin type 3 precursor [Tachysurus ichikawai]